MKPSTVAGGLVVAWAVHDLEEVWGVRHWRRTVVPRLRERHPGVPAAVWRAVGVERDQMAIAAGLVGLPILLAAAHGARTGGRSPVYQGVVTAYGWHGVGHLAVSLLVRDYTPGVLTSPLAVVAYAWWTRQSLRRAGRWTPTPARDVVFRLAVVPPLLAGAQAVARRLTSRPWWRDDGSSKLSGVRD